MKKPVYLAGPMMGMSDTEVSAWRQVASDLLGGNVLNPMTRDYRGLEDLHVTEIVEQDKADIEASRAVIAYCPQPSVGTSMEVLWAYLAHVPVITVLAHGERVSPWLRYHSHAIVRTLDDAIDQIRAIDYLSSFAR